MADGKPTLHHLDVSVKPPYLTGLSFRTVHVLPQKSQTDRSTQNSQSQRILWLLEELEIPYNLSLHYRQKSGPRKARAPPELAEIHPMGKSPQLVTADGRIIAESAAIAAYLITTYDTAKKFQGDGGRNDWVRDESLTSFAGASMGPIEMMKLFLDIATLQTPLLLRPLVRWMMGAIDRAFTGPELKQMLKYLESELGGQEYFMGKEPGRADFMLSYPMDMAEAFGWVDLGEYEGLRGWRERCQAREAWKRGLEKGNGYDMGFVMKG
jgi:glutathione S-transferase